MRFIGISLFMLFVANSYNVQAQSGSDANLSATPIAISADNKLLAASVDRWNIWIWNLQTRSKVAAIGHYTTSGWSTEAGSVSFSPSGRYMLVNTDDGWNSKEQYIYEPATDVYSKLNREYKQFFMGFCDDSTLWYSGDQLGTISLVRNAEGTVSAKPGWKIDIGKADPMDGVEKVIWDSQRQRFMVVLRNANDGKMWIAGTILPGDNMLTPIAEDVKKAIKKYDLLWVSDQAIIFRRKDEMIVMDMHTLTLHTVVSPIKERPYYFDTKTWWNYRNSEMICSYIDGSKPPIKLKTSGFSFAISPGMDVAVTRQQTTMDVYTGGDFTHPAFSVRPASGTDAIVADFVDFARSYIDSLDAFADQTLKEKWLRDGWELVPGQAYASTDDNKMELETSINGEYDYRLCRIGIDNLYDQKGGKLPGDEHVIRVVWNAKSPTYDKYATTEKSDLHFGDNSSYVFYNNLPLTAQVSIVKDHKDPLFGMLPPNAIRYYLLRKKVSSHSTAPDAINYKDYIINIKPSPSSSISSSQCTSPNMLSEDLERLRKFRDGFERSGYNIIASEINSGITVKSFDAPAYKGNVYIDIFTTSPCNEVVLYNTTANTRVQATANAGSGSFLDPEKQQFVRSNNFYIARITMEQTANTGSSFNVVVRNKNGHTTEGATFIMVWHN